MSKSILLSLKQADHAKNERDIWPQLDHPFIVKYESFAQDQGCIYFVQEFVWGGEFRVLLNEMGRMIDITDTQFFLSQMVLALDYLHSSGIVYRDLKPWNILIGRDGYLKLIDFGLSKKIFDKDLKELRKTNTVCGTPCYTAPEVLEHKAYSFEVDYWALGVTLYEMVIGVLPFQGDSPQELYKQIIQAKPLIPGSLNRDVTKLITGLLRKDPKKRYGAK